MSITVVCPACGGKMSAPSQLIGRMAKCPRCAKAIKVVPSADSPAPAVAYQTAAAPTPSRDLSDGPAAEEQAAATKRQSVWSIRRMGLPIAGLVVSLAAAVIVVLWFGQTGPFLGTAGSQHGLDQVTEVTGTEASREVNNAAPKPSEQKDGPWVDASNGPIQHGDIRVQLTSVTVRNVRIRDVLGEETVSPTKNLTIGVVIENTSTTRRIEFPGWSGAAAALTPAELLTGTENSKANRTDTSSAADRNAARLTDNFGHLYKRISLDSGAHIPGQITATSLDPGKRLEDLLVFEPPTDEVQLLRLELPAAAFGDSGVLRQQIPKDMIRR